MKKITTSSASHALVISSCMLAGAISLNVNAVELTEDLNLDLTAEVVSDYLSQGVSQTMGDPALQLSAFLSHSSGLFAGLWSSNLQFVGEKARREDGYYAGYYHEFSDNINASASIARYEYPHQAVWDLNEFYGELNIYNVKIGYTYDFDMEEAPNFASQFIGYTFALPAQTELFIHYGYTDLGYEVYASNGDNRQTYSDWGAKLSKEFYGLNFSLAYSDTDLSDSECEYNMGDDDLCGPTVVFGVAKTF